MGALRSFIVYPCSLLTLLLAILVGYLIGTSPQGVQVPFTPTKSVTNDVPPWPIFRLAVAMNDFFAQLTHATTLPKVNVINLATAHWKSELTYAMAKHGIVDIIFENGGSMTCEEVAGQLQFNKPFLCRFFSAVEGIGLLTLNSDGTYSPTASGSLLSKNSEGSLRAFVLMINTHGDYWRALVDKSLQSGRSAIQEAMGKGYWEYLAENPEDEAEFDAAMTSFTFGAAASIISDYPIPVDGKICDIGGGVGTTLVLLLEHYPKASGIVFDRPEVVTRGNEYLAKYGVSDRAVALGGDFLAQLPEQLAECDVFMLKHILHDWPDTESVTILKNIAAIAKSGAKIAIVEHILGTSGCWGMEVSKRLMDINMMQACPAGAKERSVEQYEILLSSAAISAKTQLYSLRDILSVFEASL